MGYIEIYEGYYHKGTVWYFMLLEAIFLVYYTVYKHLWIIIRDAQNIINNYIETEIAESQLRCLIFVFIEINVSD